MAKERGKELRRRAEERKREIGVDGTDGGGRAVNEMRLGWRKPSASTAAGLAPPAMWRITPERACGKHKSQMLVPAIYIGKEIDGNIAIYIDIIYGEQSV